MLPGVTQWRSSVRVVPSYPAVKEYLKLLPDSTHLSAAAFCSVPAANRVALLVDAPSNPPTGLPTTAGIAGALLMEISCARNANVAQVKIHSLGVHESVQDRGLASALLMRAVDVAVAHVIDDPNETGAFVCASALSFCLADGHCRRNWDVLLLLLRHGWRIWTQGAAELLVGHAHRYRAEKRSVYEFDLTVAGPMVPLRGPVLYPGVQSGVQLFKKPVQLAAPPPRITSRGEKWTKSYKINDNLQRGIIPLCVESGVRPLPAKGLLPFFANVRDCQVLEDYLADVANHTFNVTTDKHDREILVHKLRLPGGTELEGYMDYGTLNGKHDSLLQSVRTLKTKGKAQVHTALMELPGCRDILQSAMERLGHGGITVEQMTNALRHLHILNLDRHAQVDFGWHEDTYDLNVTESQRDTTLSIIVQLSATFTTAMQLWGFAYHEYPGQAAGVVFHGRALHRSVPRVHIPHHRSVWKIAYFVDASALPSRRVGAKSKKPCEAC
jgi:GNAT superfamily N-acetyltransferase